MIPMTRYVDVLRTWWDEQRYAWEVLLRAQRPWEQEGPLRWQRRYGTGWELHGRTLPAEPITPDRGRRH
jgi:hypothetical protein